MKPRGSISRVLHGAGALALGGWLALAGTTALAQAQKAPPARFGDAMRGATPIPEASKPPPIFPTENKDVRRTRNYAMQPPTIPHAIDNYQLDKDYNRCMACHARTVAQDTGAIPVSITHYMDRNNNVLAEVSPRRYFCTQCHVPQAEAKPLVTNTFVDVERLLQRKPGVLGSTK